MKLWRWVAASRTSAAAFHRLRNRVAESHRHSWWHRWPTGRILCTWVPRNRYRSSYRRRRRDLQRRRRTCSQVERSRFRRPSLIRIPKRGRRHRALLSSSSSARRRRRLKRSSSEHHLPSCTPIHRNHEEAYNYSDLQPVCSNSVNFEAEW